MIIELHNHGRQTQRLSATRVLIRDEKGTPLAFVLEIEPGHYRLSHAGEPDFSRYLQEHGIDRTVVVDRLDLRKLPRPD